MSDKLVIDVVTLDAIQCAACTYMLETISALPDYVKEHITFKEWSIKNEEGINKFVEHGVKVLPTVVIKGDLVFESLYPSFEELLDALDKYAETDDFKAALAKARAEAD